MTASRISVSAILSLAAILLTSCAESPVQRQQVFHEEDFRGYGGSGSGAVVGRAYVAMRDHSERVMANDSIELTPVTPYSTEAVNVIFAQNREITGVDPRFQKYIRTAPTDGDGNFAFHNLPSGDYYLTGAVYFTRWFWSMDNTEKVVMHDCVPIYTQVSVKGGQTVRVTDWNYGRTTSK